MKNKAINSNLEILAIDFSYQFYIYFIDWELKIIK